MDPVIYFSFWVISAFWVGEQRQQITAGALRAISKNKFELLLFKIEFRA